MSMTKNALDLATKLQLNRTRAVLIFCACASRGQVRVRVLYTADIDNKVR